MANLFRPNYYNCNVLCYINLFVQLTSVHHDSTLVQFTPLRAPLLYKLTRNNKKNYNMIHHVIIGGFIDVYSVVLAKMDLYKYHNVLHVLLELAPGTNTSTGSMVRGNDSIQYIYCNVFIVPCLLFDTYYMKCCCVNICKGLK